MIPTSLVLPPPPSEWFDMEFCCIQYFSTSIARLFFVCVFFVVVFLFILHHWVALAVISDATLVYVQRYTCTFAWLQKDKGSSITCVCLRYKCGEINRGTHLWHILQGGNPMLCVNYGKLASCSKFILESLWKFVMVVTATVLRGLAVMFHMFTFVVRYNYKPQAVVSRLLYTSSFFVTVSLAEIMWLGH